MLRDDPIYGKRILLAVTNDLVADQRLKRSALSLAGKGARVELIGRRLPGKNIQPGTAEQPEPGVKPGREDKPGAHYTARRMRLLFRRGPLFYACYNLRLFLRLVFSRADLIVSNDLDTLPACYLAAVIRRLPLVYDSHEYFTQVPELVNRHRTRRIWERMEGWILPKLHYAMTVSGPVAEAYRDKYGIDMKVVRNLPMPDRRIARRPDLLLCGPRRIILYQGALNLGRGLESMIRAMVYLEDFDFQVFGDGDIAGELKELAYKEGVGERVIFMGRRDPGELRELTRQASLGISLEEDLGLNYRYALPNKLFDYIQAGVPVLVSDLPEMARIVTGYGIGEILRNREPEKLAEQVSDMMNSHEKRMGWKKKLRIAAGELNWEREEPLLLDLFRKALSGIRTA